MSIGVEAGGRNANIEVALGDCQSSKDTEEHDACTESKRPLAR